MHYTLKRQLTIYLPINIVIHAKQKTTLFYTLFRIFRKTSTDNGCDARDLRYSGCGKLKVSVVIQHNIVLSVTAWHT